MSKKEGSVVPVILSGGSGSRLWPLSRKMFPKQLLALVGPGTMLQDTIARVRGESFATPIVISNQDQRFLVAEQLRAVGANESKIILEPAGRNTAPAVTVAVLKIIEGDADALALVMPSDHVVGDHKAFEAAVRVAIKAARGGALVTFGIKPSAPETGYGYIKSAGELQDAPGAFTIEHFVEKPDRATAERYLASGEYFWNSGMFLFSAKAFLSEMERLEPETLRFCRDAIAHAYRDMDFIRLDESAFSACSSQSIDYAVMEHASNAAVVPVEIGWSDVGSWQSLWSISLRTAEGNAILGDVLVEDSRNCYIRSEGPLVAAVGIENLVVVASKDAVLVSSRDKAQDVKKIVAQLETNKRDHHNNHPLVHRPWGSYESVDAGQRFQVKRIIVKPGAKLSLQMHHHRAEHWIVVSGVARVSCDEREFLLRENESTYIPPGSKHRLENPGKMELHLIEVQSGAYLGEDDIVRFEDTYGRVAQPVAPK